MYLGSRVKEYEIEDNKNEVFVRLEKGEIPEYLKTLIENDPNFLSEIKSQDLENAFIDLNSEEIRDIDKKITSATVSPMRSMVYLIKIDF